ncbi:Cro/CI family transcriptional regulator [Chitinimonas sp. PSY-7]|uniref:Cro/CI family transcriptional regulator n=1 Tax=Chitinimonas sp. PSY-7 TaxID=3459088 RepID=UPI0040401811
MKKSFVLTFMGGARKAAEAIGISQPAIAQWAETLPDSAVGRIARVRRDVLLAWWAHESHENKTKRELGSATELY